MIEHILLINGIKYYIISGTAVTANGSQAYITRYTINGLLDTTFGTNGVTYFSYNILSYGTVADLSPFHRSKNEF